MSIFSDYVTAPYQGVSQAPPQVRLPEQATAIEDTMIAIPQGATKRPPFTWQGLLSGHSGSPNGIMQAIGRNTVSDSLMLTITNDSDTVNALLYDLSDFPQAYDPSGVSPLSVTISTAAQAYLNSGSPVPKDDIRVLTIADYTFIVNRKVTVAKQAGTAIGRPFEAILWVRQAGYGRKYNVVVTPSGGSPTTVTLKTPDGTSAADSDYVDTDVIAKALLTGTYTTLDGSSISGNLSSLSGFTVSQFGPIIYMSHPTIDFTVDIEDGQGGQAFIAVKDKVQTYEDLPKRAKDGFTVRVIQQGGTPDDDFYVEFQDSAGDGTGTWVEVIAPGAELGLDPAFMPIGLRNPTGSAWVLDVLPWTGRLVGDQLLSPDPDFVGRNIEDLSFWRGRLVVISGEGCTCSNASNPFQLYPTTLATVLDDDAFTLLSPYPDISTFRYAIPYDQRLFVFGDKAQFQVSSDGVLAPSTARIDTMMSYAFSQALRPQASNGKIYFGAPKGQTASTVYEVQVNRQANVTDAEDLTTHVPTYLPATLDTVASCPINYAILYGTRNSPDLYVHLFRYAEGQRVQNAHSRWHLPQGFSLGGMFFINTQLFLLACHGSAAHLVMADLSPGILDNTSARILTNLDFRCTQDQVNIAYAADTDLTTITLPYPHSSGTPQPIRATVPYPGGNGGPNLTEAGPPAAPEGYSATVLSYASTSNIVLRGQWDSCPLWFGFAYTSKVTLSRLYVMGTDNKPLLSGRLSIRRMAIDLASTGYLRVEVSAKGRTTRKYAFEGYRYDDPESVYNVAPSLTTTYNVPIGSQNTQVDISFINDSHLPSQVLGYEWRGDITPKATRA